MTQTNPIPVDFGNADEDGAVRLVTQGTIEHLKSSGLELGEGMKVTMSDGELTAEGTCTQRKGMWVAVVTRWVK